MENNILDSLLFFLGCLHYVFIYYNIDIHVSCVSFVVEISCGLREAQVGAESVKENLSEASEAAQEEIVVISIIKLGSVRVPWGQRLNQWMW